MTISPWRAVARIAWRDAWRSKGRSLLVIALIGLPVFALTAGDVIYRTYQLSPIESYQRANGAASVEMTPTAAREVQNPAGTMSDALTRLRHVRVDAAGSPVVSVATVERLLGPGTHAIIRRTEASTTVRTKAGLGLAEIVGVDYAGPVASGIAHQLSGRPARSVHEVDVTPTLASEAGLQIGSVLRSYYPARRFTVVGIVSDPSGARVVEAFTVPAAIVGEDQGVDFLARTVRPVGWQELQRLNRLGWIVQSRQVVGHPPSTAEAGFDPQTATSGLSARVARPVLVSGVVIVGLALLEVILLAGPAFAIMARRQERALARVAAVGGRRRDLRNTVLAYGVVLGVTGGVAAIGLGVAAARLFLPLVGHLGHSRPGPFAVRPLDLAGILAVSLGTALAAAVVPARAAASTDVVAALAGRRPRRRARLRVPVAAALVSGLGVLVALGGARRGSSTTTLLAGLVLIELGLVIATPTLLLIVTSVGRYLPLAPRLALRDAGRNRSSAAPAVAAVMAAVIGCVVVLLGVTSETAMESRTYQPQALAGDVSVIVPAPSLAGPVAAAMHRDLPARSVQVLSDPGRDCASCSGVQIAPVVPPGQTRTTRYGQGSGGQAVIAGANALRALTGVDPPAAVAALDSGHAVVTDAWAVHDGVAALQVQTYRPDGTRTRVVHVPAVALTTGFPAAQVILPPALVASLGVGSHPYEVLADDRTMPTGAQIQALRASLASVAADHPESVDQGATTFQFRVETGFVNKYKARMALLLLAAAVVAIGAAGIATRLSNEDRADDFLVLEAVGAAARTRRVVSAARATVIAGLGAMIGTVAGFVPVVAWIASRNRGLSGSPPPGPSSATRGTLLTPTVSYALHLSVPWLSLGAVVIGIPLVAALLAGGLSRSRLPVNRRHRPAVA
jgi:putative ABC transport system permease protein